MNGLIDRFTSEPDPAEAGNDVEICFKNPDLAGTTVTIRISNGQGTEEDTIDIDLDENGEGCKTWPVPATGWNALLLNEPTSLEHTTPVVGTSGSD